MIRLLKGCVGSGKSTRILAEVAQATQAGERALLIVPEQTTLQTEFLLEERLRTPGFLLTEVLSPSRLIQRVNEAVGGMAGTVLIDERGRAMALRAVMHKLDSTLQVYRASAARAGFIQWMTQLFSEFSQGEIVPTDLRLAADALPEGLERMKFFDLAAIGDAYEDMLRGRFLDTKQEIDLFLDNVGEADFLRGTRVWVDGFDILPPRTLRMLVGLAGAVPDMTIAMTLQEDALARERLFAPVRQSTLRLRAFAQRGGVPLVEESMPREVYRSAEIGHLESAWGDASAAPYEGEMEDIHLRVAPTPREECEAAADAMVQCHRERGLSFGDMACALADEESYAPLMRRALEQRGIPHFIAQPSTVHSHPAVRYWLAAMEAGSTGLRREAMGRTLRSGYAGIGEDAADLLDNRMVQRGMWGRAWSAAIEEDEEMEAARATMIGPIAAFAQRAKDGANGRALATCAYQLLEEAGIYARLMQDIARAESLGEGALAEQHAQVWRQMVAVLDQMADLLGEQELSVKEFLLALTSGLDSAMLSVLPPRPGQVTVTLLSRVKNAGTRALFLLGANAGMLPKEGGAEGLVVNFERDHFNEASARAGSEVRLNGAKERDEAQSFSIYAALTLPCDTLYIFYAQSSQEGTAQRPSRLVEEMRRLFPKLREKSTGKTLPAGAQTALWVAARRLKEDGQDEDARCAWRALASMGEARPALRKAQEAMDPPTSPPARVERETAARLYELTSMSATRVERFARCPCLHFIEHALRPIALYEPGIRMSDAGSFLHEALNNIAAAVAREKNGWGQMTPQEMDALLAREAGPILHEMADRPGYGGGYATAELGELWRKLAKTAQLLRLQLRESRFVPIGQEIPFGPGAPYPPLDIQVQGHGAIQLRGVIDRVDVLWEPNERLLRVVDYKSGNDRFDWDALSAGLRLQLPLYAQVAQDALGVRAAGFFYSKITDEIVSVDEEDEVADKLLRAHSLQGLILNDVDVAAAMDPSLVSLPVKKNKDGTLGKTNKAVSAQELQGVMDQARDTAAGLIGRMLDGEIEPQPAIVGKKIACEHCDYVGVCGYAL